MYIKYADGRPLDKVEVEDSGEAGDIIRREYPDAVFADDWEIRGYRGETPIYRLLVWENEEIAGEPGCGDDGSHAIAEIVDEEGA